MNYICNPININYRYQFIKDSAAKECRVARESADPSMIYYKRKYYIFASMTLGVWESVDLAHWNNHKLPRNLPLYDYAPDVRVIGEYVYFSASDCERNCNFYRTKDIVNGPYEEITGVFDFWDPNLFCDDDGRVYFYWGCDDQMPIWGTELDPRTMRPLEERKVLIEGDASVKGYERTGEDYSDTLCNRPYIEGAWMDKYEGKYYLQYACPGTEYNIYADGVYVSDSPLGPFILAQNNPYSYKPGGFLPGAGHGSTLEDREGNLWHAATMRISVNHLFERRVGLWPAGYDADGELFCNQRYGDWPFMIEERKMDPWKNPEWFLLSYGKTVRASSFCEGKEPEKAVDENVQTWWRAASAGSGEWIEVDLGEIYDVRAVQINFADDKIQMIAPGEMQRGIEPRYIEEKDHVTRWLLEGSVDGVNYMMIENKAEAGTDLSHDLVVRQEGIKARYLRLTVLEIPYRQNSCISGLRAFGIGKGKKPEAPCFKAVRIGDLDMEVKISEIGAVGYNILWGHKPEKLYHSYMVFGRSQRIGALVKGRHYYVRVDAFNENGITEGTEIVRV